MPNPLFSAGSAKGKKFVKRLTKRQKTLIKGVRQAGLPVHFYRRKGNRNKVSVHDPRQDVLKRARGANTKTVRSYPQAFDTKAQRGAKKKLINKARMRKGRLAKKSKFRNVLLP